MLFRLNVFDSMFIVISFGLSTPTAEEFLIQTLVLQLTKTEKHTTQNPGVVGSTQSVIHPC